MEELKLRTFQEWYDFNKDYISKCFHYIIRIYSSFSLENREVFDCQIEVTECTLEYALKIFGSFYMYRFEWAPGGFTQILAINLLDPDCEVKE